MGVFLNLVVFKNQAQADLEELIKELAEGDNQFGILPEQCSFFECEAGTVIELNEYCYADGELAAVLSQKLGRSVLVCGIYDDDFWFYHFAEKGVELDKFMTVPDCLEEIPDEEWEQWRGNAELLAEEFGCEAESTITTDGGVSWGCWKIRFDILV